MHIMLLPVYIYLKHSVVIKQLLFHFYKYVCIRFFVNSPHRVNINTVGHLNKQHTWFQNDLTQDLG